ARPDLHRRALRTEFPPHPGAQVGLRLLVELGLDHLHDDPPARLLPLARRDRRRPAATFEGAAAADARPAHASRKAPARQLDLSSIALSTIIPCPISSVQTAGNGRSTTTARKVSPARPSRATAAASASCSSSW